jgi:molecular chaperone GrpE
MSRKQGKDEAMEREQSIDGTAEDTMGVDGGTTAENGTSGDPAELEALRAERDTWKERTDQALRLAAEKDTALRRSRQDIEDARKYASEKLIADLLPVVDNFARALEAAEQNPSVEALKEGVDATHRQLMDALQRVGLARIEALGQPFDPNVHEAIMQVAPTDGQEANQVVEELRAGYKLHDRVVRPSLVKVTSG